MRTRYAINHLVKEIHDCAVLVQITRSAVSVLSVVALAVKIQTAVPIHPSVTII